MLKCIRLSPVLFFLHFSLRYKALRSVTLMTAAPVVATGVPFSAVLVIVMIALNIRIVSKLTCKKCFNGLVARSADTTKELDTRFCKSHLSSATDATADNSIRSDCFQKTG